MRSYLSFGGGVNSVAMYLLLVSEGMKPADPDNGFEAVYVDHGGDWPETHEYLKMFSEKYPVTVLRPMAMGYDNLYNYCFSAKTIPSRTRRWCTDKFKARAIRQYCKIPCFQLIGISSEESHRAKIAYGQGVENRFPLIERNIDRDACEQIIKDCGLPVPIKSGCYFCPFQRKGQFKLLKREHPELYCKAKQLEDNCVADRISRGKWPIYLYGKHSIDKVVDDNQTAIWEDLDPPCNCML